MALSAEHCMQCGSSFFLGGVAGWIQKGFAAVVLVVAAVIALLMYLGRI